MSTDSKKDIKSFYEALGAQGLADLLSPARHQAYLDFLQKVLPTQGTILDCACGYGRLTIPLAKAGYTMAGIDLSEAFIKKARDLAGEQKVEIPFVVGNMCELPYQDARFDAVICMWSSFNELLEVSGQIKALKEMYRVIRPTGFVLIDMPCPPDHDPIADDERVSEAMLGGHEHVAFIHDEQSLEKLMCICGIAQFSITRVVMGGIERLILRMDKCT